MHLRSLILDRPSPAPETFPFSVPTIHSLRELAFDRGVTFFVGENGSGKSTLLEAMAVGMRMVAVGAEDLPRDTCGLYLLDEPEAPLSPARQLALITVIKDAIDKDCQFVIATHSPILLAYPQARIYSFDGGTINSVAFTDLEHVALTKAFLQNPETYLRHIFSESEQ